MFCGSINGKCRFKQGLLGLLLCAVLSLNSCALQQSEDSFGMTSPNERYSVNATIDKGQLSYKVSEGCDAIIDDSRLGLEINGDAISGFQKKGFHKKVIDSSWQPVWGKQHTIRDHCHEYTIQARATKPNTLEMDIIFRVYDDAIAFRYVLKSIEGTSKTTITDDLSQFQFANDATAWSYNGEGANKGPERVSEIDGERRWPVTIKMDRYWMALCEAHIENFSWMTLESQRDSGGFDASIYVSSVKLPFATPWRVIMISDKVTSLVDSNILENLNPPCQIKDPSWIKPGVSFWDWRAWGHQVDDFTYGLDRPSWERFVDLAVESKVPYLLLDADWYGPEFEQGSDPTTTEKGVPTFIQYAKERGVGVFLYLNDVGANKYGLERVLKQFADWGAVGIKYGFMRKKAGQPKVNWTRKVVKICAKYKLMCNFHDAPVPPCGDYRTWPNYLTREYCHAQSDAKSSFTPSTFTTSVFVNMLAGPLDMSNGMFDLDNSAKQRPRVYKEIPSTITSEAARTLIVFSGLTVVPDTADAYKQHPVLFDFIASQKMPWDQSKTLAGELGEYIVMMRQTGQTYLIGVAGNETARSLEISLDFLPSGSYKAVIGEDTAETHYLNNRQAYKTREMTVDKTKTIQLELAPGGGACIKLTPLEIKTSDS